MTGLIKRAGSTKPLTNPTAHEPCFIHAEFAVASKRDCRMDVV